MIKYKPKEITITGYEQNTPTVKNVVIIVEQELNSDIWIPSSLTEIIYFKYSSYSINTQLGIAHVICEFLNYLNDQINIEESPIFFDLKNKGLFGLNLFHASKYLTYLNFSKNNSYKTVKWKENLILQFYRYLIKKNFLDPSVVINTKLMETSSNAFYRKNTGIRESLVSPFNEPPYSVIYPDKNKKTTKPKLQNLTQAEWELLIEVAEEEAPDIVLGIAFQIMGGIRRGEVVNLLIDSIEIDQSNSRLKANIMDNQGILFQGRNINTDKCQVKKPRDNQPIFNFNGDLLRIWDNHLSMLGSLKNRRNLKALFIDSDGYPMTGDVYQKRFKDLKESFLNKLSERKYSLAKSYREYYKWGTHIGRHIYTNYLLLNGLCNNSLGKPEARILANLRGDSNEYSAKVYIDNLTIANLVDEKIKTISEMADNE